MPVLLTLLCLAIPIDDFAFEQVLDKFRVDASGRAAAERLRSIANAAIDNYTKIESVDARFTAVRHRREGSSQKYSGRTCKNGNAIRYEYTKEGDDEYLNAVLSLPNHFAYTYWNIANGPFMEIREPPDPRTFVLINSDVHKTYLSPSVHAGPHPPGLYGEKQGWWRNYAKAQLLEDGVVEISTADGGATRYYTGPSGGLCNRTAIGRLKDGVFSPLCEWTVDWKKHGEVHYPSAYRKTGYSVDGKPFQIIDLFITDVKINEGFSDPKLFTIGGMPEPTVMKGVDLRLPEEPVGIVREGDRVRPERPGDRISSDEERAAIRAKRHKEMARVAKKQPAPPKPEKK